MPIGKMIINTHTQNVCCSEAVSVSVSVRVVLLAGVAVVQC